MYQIAETWEGKQRGHYAGIATLTGRQLRKSTKGRRPVGIQGKFTKCLKVSGAGRPEWVKCYLNGMKAASQIKPENYGNGKSSSGVSQSRSTSKHRILTTAYSTTKTYPPTLEEVCIRQLHNNRAPGEDGIPVEVYKTCLDSLGPCLLGIITSWVLWGRPT